MTIKQIMQINNNLEKIFDKKLPIKFSFILAKNKRKIQDILDIYQQERIKLLKKYAKKDENGEIITDEEGKVKIQHFNTFSKQLDELLNLQQDIKLDKISEEEFNNYDLKLYDILTPENLNGIIDMIN